MEKIVELKKAIEEKSIIDTKLKEAKEKLLLEFAQTFAEEIEAQANYNEEIELLKAELSESAIENFKNTNEKNYLGGIKVQEVKKIVYDEKIAEMFAFEKKMFLLFDKKGFDKAAESLNLDFVKIDKNLRVTFPAEIKI